jgi:SHS2 domain-containing protein
MEPSEETAADRERGARSGYTFFDHTADIGIRASGATLAELLGQLARGLTALIAEDSRLQAHETRDIRLTAADPEALALAWLQELLYWFSTDRFLPVEFELAEVTETSVRGSVRGERFDPSRHVQGREVKAITRHLLSVRHENGTWRGEVIVDI